MVLYIIQHIWIWCGPSPPLFWKGSNKCCRDTFVGHDIVPLHLKQYTCRTHIQDTKNTILDCCLSNEIMARVVRFPGPKNAPNHWGQYHSLQMNFCIRCWGGGGRVGLTWSGAFKQVTEINHKCKEDTDSKSRCFWYTHAKPLDILHSHIRESRARHDLEANRSSKQDLRLQSNASDRTFRDETMKQKQCKDHLKIQTPSLRTAVCVFPSDPSPTANN